MEIVVEMNEKFKRADDVFKSASGPTIHITPPLNEDYWMFRVKLNEHGQAIIAFPKFGTIGCGFAKEEDWNTNLPISCDAGEIYKHIAHNKGDAAISKQDCIAAIKAIQEVAIPWLRKTVSA